jgi:hypothetical protein
MNKQAITEALTANHNSFIHYLNDLSAEDYLFSHQQKWTAGQQQVHIILCVKALVYVFSMDKPMIAQTFGKADRSSRTYETLLADYLQKLNEGGKAPTRFVPEPVAADQQKALNEKLEKLVKELCAKIETFTEAELDSLLIPHPLLGNLTLREMLYNAICHVEHHHEAAKRNLGKGDQ